MRAYRLHSASWATIVTQRVRRPESIAGRLASRRRPDEPIPSDGQLVLLKCNHQFDPRSGEPVERRELLDRTIEALSIPEVDGVIGSADILEELTLLNMLEHRLVYCLSGPSASTIAASHFDGAMILDPDPSVIRDQVAEMAANGLPAIAGLTIGEAGDEFESSWKEWIGPMSQITSKVTTGAGLWLTIPAISGVSHIAEWSGFPVLMRDTDVPIHPASWQSFFESELPLTIRGMVPGVSALFPIEGSVAEATATIARAVRNRVAS